MRNTSKINTWIVPSLTALVLFASGCGKSSNRRVDDNFIFSGQTPPTFEVFASTPGYLETGVSVDLKEALISFTEDIEETSMPTAVSVSKTESNTPQRLIQGQDYFLDVLSGQPTVMVVRFAVGVITDNADWTIEISPSIRSKSGKNLVGTAKVEFSTGIGAAGSLNGAIPGQKPTVLSWQLVTNFYPTFHMFWRVRFSEGVRLTSATMIHGGINTYFATSQPQIQGRLDTHLFYYPGGGTQCALLIGSHELELGQFVDLNGETSDDAAHPGGTWKSPQKAVSTGLAAAALAMGSCN